MFRFAKTKPRNYEAFESGIKTKKNRSNRYEEWKYIGEGGMGVVLLARDLATNEYVAIKKSSFREKRSITLSEKTFLEVVNNINPMTETSESRLTQSRVEKDEALPPSNYVIEYKEAILVEKFDDDGASKSLNLLKTKLPSSYELWIIQEYCEFGDLYHVMRTLKRGFNLGEIKHLVANIVLGLFFIHTKGIVHRDIKCLNILLTRAGRVKICDFGRAEKCDMKRQHDVVRSRVTDLWMAPEMYQDNAIYGFEVDIWALGISMLEMFHENPPFSDQHSGMVGGNIMNLPTMRLAEQRQALGIPPPPKELVEKSKGKNNNYHGFYEDDLAYFENKFKQENEDHNASSTEQNYASRISRRTMGEELDDHDPLSVLHQFSNMRLSLDGLSELKQFDVMEESDETDIQGEPIGYFPRKHKMSGASGTSGRGKNGRSTAVKSDRFVEVDLTHGKGYRRKESPKQAHTRCTDIVENSDVADTESDDTFIDKSSQNTSKTTVFGKVRDTMRKKKPKKNSQDNTKKQQRHQRKKRAKRFLAGPLSRQDRALSNNTLLTAESDERDDKELEMEYTGPWPGPPRPSSVSNVSKISKFSKQSKQSKLSKNNPRSKLRNKNRKRGGIDLEYVSSDDEIGADFSATSGLGVRYKVSVKGGAKSKKPSKRKNQTNISSASGYFPTIRKNRKTFGGQPKNNSKMNLISEEQRQKEREQEKLRLITIRKQEEQLKQRRRQKRIEWKKRHSYTQLQTYSEEVMFFEFISWCLSTNQQRRPTAFELTEHPFIKKEVRSLLRSERSDCSIREHSDFLLRSDDLSSPELRKDDIEEQESDDDDLLTEEERKLVLKQCHATHGQENEDDYCTCSVSQKALRETLCAELSKNGKVS